MQPEILCDAHLTPMKLLVTATGTDTNRREAWSDTFRCCSEPGCFSHFNRNKGYVEIRDFQITDHKHNWCRGHKEPKAIVAVQFERPLWQCLHEECLCRKTMLGGTISVCDVVLPAHPYHGRYKVRSIGEDGFATLQMVGNSGDGDFLMDHWENIPVDRLSRFDFSLEKL